MPKYYVEFKEKQIHAYGYYVDANSTEEAYEKADEIYFNDGPPDSLEVLDARYFEHKVEEA